MKFYLVLFNGLLLAMLALESLVFEGLKSEHEDGMFGVWAHSRLLLCLLVTLLLFGVQA